MKNGRKILVTVLALMLMLAFLVSCDASKLLLGNKDGADSSDGSGANSGGNTDQNGGGNTNQDNGNADKNDEETKKKQTPVYQGMTITSSKISAALPGVNGSGNNGNHYGHYKGDHTGNSNDINQNNPYPDNSKDENLEEEVKDSLVVVGPAEDIYYATQNQDIYINIHINNPDSFEILSFTLNGKKYSDYMFEIGSDLETIIIKYNVGNAIGIVDYTIDAIKYIDGEEIKDVIIAGDKTVKAGVKTENQVVAEISNTFIGTNSISFGVLLEDKNGLISFSSGVAKAVIYDGNTIVDTKDLVVGENNVIFSGLKTNTLYQYAVVAKYDDLSGLGVVCSSLYKNAVYTDAIVLFDDIKVGKTDIEFNFSWYESFSNKTITELKLYKNGELIGEVSKTYHKIEDLLSGNTYELVAEYVNNFKTESIRLEFTTDANAVPTVSLSAANQTQTSIEFEIIETDTDNVGEITKIELVHESGTVVADSLDERIFTNLLSNNEYTVKITYVYDLNDGVGEKTLIKDLSLKTVGKAAPVLSINNEKVNETSISADCEISDTDETLISYKTEIYKGNSLIATSNEKRIDFANLESDTEYVLKITYTYDLCDGSGVKSNRLEKKFKTLTIIQATDCIITTTGTVFTSDTVEMQINLNNPSNVLVRSVVINGKTISVKKATYTNVTVDILCSEDFAVGATCLKIEALNYVKIVGSKEEYTSVQATDCSAEIFVNGNINVLSIDFVNERFEPYADEEWVFPSQSVYELIKIDNPTGYKINGYTKLDDETYYKEITTYGWLSSKDSISVSVNFYNDAVNKTHRQSIGCTKRLYRLSSNEVKYISTPNDLKDVDDGYYYEMTNDIDLAGVQWEGALMYGVFNGNGYSVKNMTKTGVGTFGLFSDVIGIVANVNIVGAKADVKGSCGAISAQIYEYGDTFKDLDYFNSYYQRAVIMNCTVDETTNLHGSVVGGMIGSANVSVRVVNCINKATLTASGCIGGMIGAALIEDYFYTFDVIKCTNKGMILSYNDCASVGGMIGKQTGCLIIDCINSATVQGYIAGGLVGCLTDECNAKIVDSTNSGEIKASYAGGMIGYVEFGANATILNSTNIGNITAENGVAGGLVSEFDFESYENSIINCINRGTVQGRVAGGLVGKINYQIVVIKNCMNTGTVKGSEEAGGLVGHSDDSYGLELINSVNAGDISGNDFGGLVGYPGGSVTVDNSYSSIIGNSENGTSCTVDTLNSKEFYTETLNWSEEIWDFSELDVENGKYPKHK